MRVRVCPARGSELCRFACSAGQRGIVEVEGSQPGNPPRVAQILDARLQAAVVRHEPNEREYRWQHEPECEECVAQGSGRRKESAGHPPG
jgi:hypothetical protein